MNNFIIYFFGNGVSKFFLLLLIPIMTHYLTVEQFGLSIIYYTVYQFFVICVGFSSQSAITIFYYKDSNLSLGNVLPHALGLTLINFMVLFFIVAFYSYYTDSQLILFCLGAAFFQQIILFTNGLYHIEKKALQFTSFSLAASILSILVTMAFLESDFGFQSRIYGDFLAFLLCALFSFFLLYKRDKYIPKFNFEILKRLYSLLWPLSVHSVFVFAIFFSDRIIIKFLIGDYFVGIYSASFILSQAAMLALDAKSRFWTPLVAKSNESGIYGRRWYMEAALKYLMFFSLFLLAYFFILIYLIPVFLGDEYSKAAALLPYLLLGFWFEALYREMHVHIFLAGETVIIARATAITGVFHLLISGMLIFLIGITGAGIAFLFSSIVKCLLVYFLSNKVSQCV